MDIWGGPPISLEKHMCGVEGDFPSPEAMLVIFLLLSRFSLTLSPPPFALRPSSPRLRQDGGAAAGYSFLCPTWVWPMRSLDLLGWFFFFVVGFFFLVVSTLEMFLVFLCFTKSYEAFLGTAAH